MAGLSLAAAPMPCFASSVYAESPEVARMYQDWCALTPLYYEGARSMAGLEAAFREASEDNWDGYGARPMTYGAKLRAEKFLDALPSGFPRPEIAAEPDGEVSFEWYVAPRQVFSVSVGPHNEIAYAGLFGANSAHGSEYFMDELPPEVMKNLRRLYGGHGVAG